MKNNNRVVIISPFASDDEAARKRHILYARRCIRDSLLRGEHPFASHLLYTQTGILNDTITEERQQGIAAGHAWMKAANLVAVYTDYGESGGMLSDIVYADHLKKEVVKRSIGKVDSEAPPQWKRERMVTK